MGLHLGWAMPHRTLLSMTPTAFSNMWFITPAESDQLCGAEDSISVTVLPHTGGDFHFG